MTPTDSAGSTISLLYVEDETDSRELLRELLSRHYPEVRVFVADNGKSGFESFMRIKPELVITDINMPETDGISMSAKIKSISPHTEIIALTAHSDTQYLLNAIEIGISHYIMKPLDIDLIFRVIDRSITLIRSEQEIERQNKLIRSLNAEITQKAAELELANLELESFNYTVAHDLRSPIAAICGFSEVLLEDHNSNLDDASKEYLQVIHKESLRMSKTIGALLKFSAKSRKQPFKRWTNLSGIVNEIKGNLLLMEPQRQVLFSVDEGINGYGDPDLLRIILENLLENAWKFTAQKSEGRIEFGSFKKEEELIYFVRDNGIGFDPQETNKIFFPFKRIKSDNETLGFGIGLATVSRIIQRHGGKIWAEGEKGVGATFYFTL